MSTLTPAEIEQLRAQAPDPLLHFSHLVVRKCELDPVEVWYCRSYEEAQRIYEAASAQWEGTYLVEVLRGPRRFGTPDANDQLPPSPVARLLGLLDALKVPVDREALGAEVRRVRDACSRLDLSRRERKEETDRRIGERLFALGAASASREAAMATAKSSPCQLCGNPSTLAYEASRTWLEAAEAIAPPRKDAIAAVTLAYPDPCKMATAFQQHVGCLPWESFVYGVMFERSLYGRDVTELARWRANFKGAQPEEASGAIDEVTASYEAKISSLTARVAELEAEAARREQTSQDAMRLFCEGMDLDEENREDLARPTTFEAEIERLETERDHEQEQVARRTAELNDARICLGKFNTCSKVNGLSVGPAMYAGLVAKWGWPNESIPAKFDSPLNGTTDLDAMRTAATEARAKGKTLADLIYWARRFETEPQGVGLDAVERRLAIARKMAGEAFPVVPLLAAHVETLCDVVADRDRQIAELRYHLDQRPQTRNRPSDVALDMISKLRADVAAPTVACDTTAGRPRGAHRRATGVAHADGRGGVMSSKKYKPSECRGEACQFCDEFDPGTLQPIGPVCGNSAVQVIYWKDGRISPSCGTHGLRALTLEARAEVRAIRRIRPARAALLSMPREATGTTITTNEQTATLPLGDAPRRGETLGAYRARNGLPGADTSVASTLTWGESGWTRMSPESEGA